MRIDLTCVLLLLLFSHKKKKKEKKKKDVLLIIGDWNAKVESQETPGIIGKFGLGNRIKLGKG